MLALNLGDKYYTKAMEEYGVTRLGTKYVYITATKSAYPKEIKCVVSTSTHLLLTKDTHFRTCFLYSPIGLKMSFARHKINSLLSEMRQLQLYDQLDDKPQREQADKIRHLAIALLETSNDLLAN